MTRRCILASVILAAMTLLAACGTSATPTPAATAGAPTDALAATDAPLDTPFPQTLTDDLGRTIELAAPAERVVSLAPNLTEMLFAVGAGDQVVGVTTFCNYPPEAATRTKIGGFTSDTISIEQVVALDPDLVLSTGGYQSETIDALEQAGITVVALDPNTVAQVLEAIQTVGRLTGHANEAAALTAEMEQRIEAVKAAVAGVPESQRRSVYWHIWNEPLMAAGPKSFPGQLVELAGGTNIFADTTEFYPTVSGEEVVKRNPQVIMGSHSAADQLNADALRKLPGWAAIDAVANGQIHMIDDDLVSRAGPRLVDALDAIAHALYPEQFK